MVAGKLFSTIKPFTKFKTKWGQIILKTFPGTSTRWKCFLSKKNWKWNMIPPHHLLKAKILQKMKRKTRCAFCVKCFKIEMSPSSKSVMPRHFSGARQLIGPHWHALKNGTHPTCTERKWRKDYFFPQNLGIHSMVSPFSYQVVSQTFWSISLEIGATNLLICLFFR